MKLNLEPIFDVETENKGATVKLQLRPAWRVLVDCPRVWQSHRELLERYQCRHPRWVATKLVAVLLVSWMKMRLGFQQRKTRNTRKDSAA